MRPGGPWAVIVTSEEMRGTIKAFFFFPFTDFAPICSFKIAEASKIRFHKGAPKYVCVHILCSNELKHHSVIESKLKKDKCCVTYSRRKLQFILTFSSYLAFELLSQHLCPANSANYKNGLWLLR